jgi:glycosyltransferase involved in cell wall biosynthesis
VKRRVAIVTEIIAPYRIPVFNALAQHDAIDPHVIFLADTDPHLREWRVQKDQIQFSYEVLPGWRRRVAGYNLLLNWGVARSLRRNSPEAVICGGYNYVASWQAARWSERNRIPFLLWSESTLADHRRGYYGIESLKRYFLQKCQACVVAGQSSFDYLADLCVPKHAIHTAPDAVNNQFFEDRARAARNRAAEHRLCRNLPARYFLYAGRLVREKGVFDLLEAYASLAPDLRSEIGLAFAGSGVASAELKRRSARIVPGRVHFAGFLDADDLATTYALADVLVLPTYTDTWGLVVNEAMACSLPVITTSVAGCAVDLVESGYNGLIVPPRDVQQLASAMSQLGRISGLRAAMGARSAERIRYYSPAACADGLARAACAVTRSTDSG